MIVPPWHPVNPLRALFINENIGGHATMHEHLAHVLRDHPEVDAAILNVPGKGIWRRLASAPVPGLSRLDLDLQQLRFRLAQSAHVRWLLREHAEKFDIVHFYTQNTALLSVKLLRERPSIIATDSTNELNAYQLPYRQPTRWTPQVVKATHSVEQRAWDAATMVVAKSKWAAKSLQEHYGVDEQRLRIVPFGICIPELPLRRPQRIPQVTFVGSSMARKGGWRLMDVYRRRLRQMCELNLVTRDAVADQRGVRVYNDFEPGDPRLLELLAGTDVFAFPTEVDAFGYAVLEAMAAGVPVVATKMAAMPELVLDGESGLLVPVGDDDALAEALLSLLGDADRRRRMGLAARERVERRFDARLTTTALLAVFQEALRRHGT